MKITSLKVVSDAESGWLHRRFGDHVAQISVETKMKMRLAVRDVSRQQRGYVNPEIELLAKKFPEPPQGVEDLDFVLGYDNDEGHQQGAIEVDAAIQEYVRLYPGDWEIVQQCLGLARQRSRHACAYVIGNEPIEQMIPLTTVGGVRVTAYNAPAVEAVGGLKMDFLVVNSLKDIGDCIKLIQKRHPEFEYKESSINGLRVPRFRQIPAPGGLADIWDLPDDQNVFMDVSQGRTETVFQFNTEGAIKWLKHFNYKKPNGNFAIDSIATMAYFTALDRPGPLNAYVSNPEEEDAKHNMLVEYARRARGAPKSPDILPIFDELLPHMNGIMITQEAMQYMYQTLTGCSGPEAEEFRSNVAKKKMTKVEKAYLPFIESAARKIGKENAEAVWKNFITFGQYGFNFSHAVCYSVIGYACAYLKHHYPLEWWASVLSNASKNEVSDKFWVHCGQLIKLPDVTKSGDRFTIAGDYIQAPLNVIKGVGDGAHAQLSKYGPYMDILDFCRKIEKHRVAGGGYVMKTVKYKDKDNKVLNPETGRLVSTDATKEKRTFKRGPNALNAGVVNVLMASGAMDGLFAEGLTLAEQMVEYEAAMAAAETETNMAKAEKGEVVRPVKPKKVDPSDFNLNGLQQYQSRKAVLPIYGADLIPMVIRSGKLDTLKQYPGRALMEWTSPFNGKASVIKVINADELSHDEDFVVKDKKSINVAVAAYIEDVEIRKYGPLLKEMVKVKLDVEGARFELVKFSGKAGLVPDCFRQPLKGAIAIVVLNKWTNDRPFGPEAVFVIEPPMSHSRAGAEDCGPATPSANNDGSEASEVP